MHYTDINFKTKKALKEAVAARMQYRDAQKHPPMTVGAALASNMREVPPVTVYNPEMFSGEAPTPRNGRVCVGGPHYPQPHRWYASVTIENGEVVKVS